MELSLSGVTLLILAGGEGRRLGGKIKPLARDARGRTLIDATIETLGDLVDRVHIVAPVALHEALRAAGATGLVADPGRGPARAVYAAASAVEGDVLLVVGGDVVGVSAADAAALLVALAERSEERAAVLVVDGVWQPMLCALRRTAVVAMAEVRSMYGLLEALSVVEHAGGALADVDTPRDLTDHGLRLE